MDLRKSEQRTIILVADRYNSNKQLYHETRKDYQMVVVNRFSALEASEISSVGDSCVRIKDSIKTSGSVISG